MFLLPNLAILGIYVKLEHELILDAHFTYWKHQKAFSRRDLSGSPFENLSGNWLFLMLSRQEQEVEELGEESPRTMAKEQILDIFLG